MSEKSLQIKYQEYLGHKLIDEYFYSPKKEYSLFKAGYNLAMKEMKERIEDAEKALLALNAGEEFYGNVKEVKYYTEKYGRLNDE